MKKIFVTSLITVAGIIVILSIWLHVYNGKPTLDDHHTISRQPQIKPDYTDIVIPANIAPLNFKVQEPSERYFAKIYSSKGKHIDVFSRNGKIKIPLGKWKTLLKNNRGEKLFFDIYTKSSGKQWDRYKTITNTIAKENIDSYIAYRLIKPIYNGWSDVGIYQRNLEYYNESVIFNGNSCQNVCVNCHSFNANDPEKMLIGVRSRELGSHTILAENDITKKLGTTFGHTTWHRSGKIVAYSIYNVTQFFHAARKEVRDAIELDSAILYYDIENNKAKTVPQLADKTQLETHPVWSPDGKYLYFVSTEKLWPDAKKIPPDNFENVKYSLKRIAYDIESDKWGVLETVIDSKDTGKSIIFPRFTPDGKSLIFVMCDYSCFSLFQPDADLWRLDIATGKYHALKNANSEQAESWHSISANSKWMVFSTKRHEGTFTRLYITYLKDDGQCTKAFILPQKDPEYYDSFIKCYNVPEFITGPVKTPQHKIAKTIRAKEKIEIVLPITTATPMAAEGGPWQQRE
jgi:hypothetical protein